VHGVSSAMISFQDWTRMIVNVMLKKSWDYLKRIVMIPS
jgi:hypothetical protein